MPVIPLQWAFVFQLVSYSLIPLVYVQLLFERKAFDSDMGIAVYGNMSLDEFGPRNLAMIVLTMVFRHLVIVFTAIRSSNVDVRALAKRDCLLFHILQWPLLVAFGGVDPFSNGGLQFCGIHSMYAVMFLLSYDDTKNKKN